MPISAKEESGARSMASQSSDYVAVIPIKKRRFPIIRPTSPPPQSSPALPEDICKRQGAISASAVSNSNLTEVAARPSSLVKSEKSDVPPEKQNTVIKRSNTKLPDEMHKKLQSVGKDGTGNSTVSGGSVNMEWKQRVEASHTQDNLGNFALKLSLTDGQSSVLTTSGMKSDNEDSLVRANRSNWDLNTTMDNWEASISDAASVSTDSVYGTVPSDMNKLDLKPPVASTGFVGGSISGNMNFEDRQLKVVDSLSPIPSREAHTHASSLKLGLPMPSLDLKKIQVSQCPAASIDPTPKVTRVLSSSGNSSVGVPVIVKREPFDEPLNQKLAELQAKELRTLSLNSKMVKPELVQNSGLELAGNSSHVTPNVVETALVVKAEPGLVRSHLSSITSEETANGLNEQSVKGAKLCMGGTEVLQMSKALESESTRSSDPHVGGYLDTQVSENQVMSQDAKKISSNPESSSIRPVVEEQKVSSGENTDRIQEHSIGSIGHSKSEPTGELPSSRGDEDCVSEGKIDIPAGMDQDSYDSECESDGNVAKGKERREDNEYEDGELREQPINMGQEGPTCAMQIENVANGENDHDKSESPSRPSVVSPDTENRDGEMQLEVDMDLESLNEFSDIPDEKITKTASGDAQLQESLAVETLGEFHMDSPSASQREVGPSATNNPLEGQDVEYIPGEAADSNISSMANLAPSIYPNAEYTDHVMHYDNDGEDCSTLAEMEACLHSEIVGKDGSDVNRTRVINLSRGYHMSSPGKTRSPDRSLPVQFGRKRLPDVALEGEKPHLQGRDEVYGDDFNRFSRERNRDMYSRNPRSSYTRDRGRGHNNMCSADWEPDQDFGSGGIYNGPVEYRTARYNKYGSDYRNYGSGPNNRFSGGTGRGGRKFMNEEGLNFRDRRRPHNGRDPMVGGGPRKFRDFPDDNMEMFPCSRPHSYEESDGGFSIRGERNFNNKGLRRIHSKSPLRLRSRSPPGQWSSPRRRSPPDGYVEQTHRRSPAMYRRGERARSPPPGRACFQGDSMIRRQQGSPPPYMSRQMDDLREMNSGREHHHHHGFGRGMMHHHSRGGGSSGRGSHRTRRYDMENSRERTRGDYFRPMRGGGRFHDYSGDGGNNDERRRLGDKRGPVRHFRPYGGGEEKNFVYSNNTDEPSRSSYRMCQEEDVVYRERSSSRERQQQLERHTKNEEAEEDAAAAAAHNSDSKTRRVEEQEQEQEADFRDSDGEQNDEFDDMQQSGKRKRF